MPHLQPHWTIIITNNCFYPHFFIFPKINKQVMYTSWFHCLWWVVVILYTKNMSWPFTNTFVFVFWCIKYSTLLWKQHNTNSFLGKLPNGHTMTRYIIISGPLTCSTPCYTKSLFLFYQHLIFSSSTFWNHVPFFLTAMWVSLLLPMPFEDFFVWLDSDYSSDTILNSLDFIILHTFAIG